MGIYDRDYERSSYGSGYGDQPGFHLGQPQSVTVKLIIITVVLHIAQRLFDPDFTYFFQLHALWFKEPWRVYELLTYGFMHSVYDWRHILFNMLVLWFFGQTIEQRYGTKEFIAIYLAAIVFSGAVWNIATFMQYGFDQPQPLGVAAVGASGALSAILLLFAFNYPNATVLLFFVIPIKAWVAGLLWVAMDVFGALNRGPGDNVGYECHIGGFIFAALYFKFGWRLIDWVPTSFKLPDFKRKPPLRVHRPPTEREDKTERRLNELLDKVHAGGQDSLTAAERRELQKLSKHYQNKRR